MDNVTHSKNFAREASLPVRLLVTLTLRNDKPVYSYLILTQAAKGKHFQPHSHYSSCVFDSLDFVERQKATESFALEHVTDSEINEALSEFHDKLVTSHSLQRKRLGKLEASHTELGILRVAASAQSKRLAALEKSHKKLQDLRATLDARKLAKKQRGRISFIFERKSK